MDSLRCSFMVSARISAGVALAPSSAVAASPGRAFRTMNVRKVTPHSTGMAMSTRRPITRRAGEPARRRDAVPPPGRLGSTLEVPGSPEVTEVLIVITVCASSVGRVDVLPEDSGQHHDGRYRGGEPGPGDPLGGDVVPGDGEQERPVRHLGDVG